MAEIVKFPQVPGQPLNKPAPKRNARPKSEKPVPLYVDPEVKEWIEDLASLSKKSVKDAVREIVEAYGIRRRLARLHEERSGELKRFEG